MKKALAVLLGLVAMMAGGEIAWLIIQRHDIVVFKDGAYTAGPEVAAIIAAGVIPGVLVTVLAWRRLVGAPLVHIPRTLLLHGAAAAPSLGAFVDKLGKQGHRVEVFTVGDTGARGGPAAPDTPLRGASLELVEAAQRGRLVLRLPPPADGDAVGFLDSYGVAGGSYEALATVVESVLRELLPELKQ
jgi:hypothetical protein